jgi:hypothetical protein
MIKRSLIEEYNIQFDETSIRNDVIFSFLVGFHASKIGIDARAIYCLTFREGSISYSCLNIEKKLSIISVFGRYSLLCKVNHISIMTEYNLMHINQLIKIFLFDHTNYYRAKNVLIELGYSEGNILAGIFFL